MHSKACRLRIPVQARPLARLCPSSNYPAAAQVPPHQWFEVLGVQKEALGGAGILDVGRRHSSHQEAALADLQRETKQGKSSAGAAVSNGAQLVLMATDFNHHARGLPPASPHHSRAGRRSRRQRGPPRRPRSCQCRSTAWHGHSCVRQGISPTMSPWLVGGRRQAFPGINTRK